MTHLLKILTPYYYAVLRGSKTFEVRFNDRDFKEGDTVILSEFDGTNFVGSPDLRFIIGFIYELGNGYIVFSLLKWSDK